MPDDKTKPGGQDRERISLQEDYEVRDWSRSLDCSEADLREAVAEVGLSAESVRAYLAQNSKASGETRQQSR